MKCTPKSHCAGDTLSGVGVSGSIDPPPCGSILGQGLYRHRHRPAPISHNPPCPPLNPAHTGQQLTCERELKRLTLVVGRTLLTKPKTILAGVILDLFFARSISLMATFNIEKTPLCSFGSFDSWSIVGTRGRCKVWGWCQGERTRTLMRISGRPS